MNPVDGRGATTEPRFLSRGDHEGSGERVEELIGRILEITRVESVGDYSVFHGNPVPGAGSAFEAVLPEIERRGGLAAIQRTGPGTAALVVGSAAASEVVPRRSRPWVNLGLLLATLITTTWAGALHVGTDLLARPGQWSDGLPYALALLLILGVHEMGHYLVARVRRVRVSLPYFIPVPFFLGTFGAFIRMEGEVSDRNAFFDIGVAGPLAGLVVAVAAVLIGVAAGPAGGVGGHGMIPDSSLLFGALYRLGGGAAPGAPVTLGPIAFAGWLGLLVTALNLIPVGQLDGGHVAYALLGRARSRVVGRIAIGIMLIIGIFYSYHWLMWGLFVWVLAGTGHAPSRNELTPLTRGRIVLACGTLLLFLSIIVPWPA